MLTVMWMQKCEKETKAISSDTQKLYASKEDSERRKHENDDEQEDTKWKTTRHVFIYGFLFVNKIVCTIFFSFFSSSFQKKKNVFPSTKCGIVDTFFQLLFHFDFSISKYFVSPLLPYVQFSHAVLIHSLTSRLGSFLQMEEYNMWMFWTKTNKYKNHIKTEKLSQFDYYFLIFLSILVSIRRP